MQQKYRKITPADVFILKSDLYLPKSALNKITPFVPQPSGNDFIDLFTYLISENCNKSTAFYANSMGIEERLFKSAISAITGISAKDFVDEYIRLNICYLLEHTDWSITTIGKQFGHSSVSSFSQYFRRLMKCQPYEYRNLKKYGKKITYHYYE